jgi:very-short-patch-repair endonuclease
MQGPSMKRPDLHRSAGRSLDRVLFDIAGDHLVVTRAQLVAAGIGRDAIAARVRDGRLTRVFRGVYRVGPIDAPWTREAAALLACGRHSALSLESGAATCGLRGRPHEVDVTIAAGHRAGQAGIRVHHARLERHEICVRHGLRVTSPERTLLDLAATTDPRRLARDVNEALVQRLTTTAALRAYVATRSHHRGARALGEALALEPRLTRSEAEQRMLALIRRIGLPTPRTNVMVLGHEVDFLWPGERLIVETDGFGTHGTHAAFERDRRRDAKLQAAGYRVLRFTWWQLVNEPDVIAARLAVALATTPGAALATTTGAATTPGATPVSASRA